MDVARNQYTEVCVYCHTPHGASTSVEAPLWNKAAGTAALTAYDSTTLDGDILAVGSVSIACLSCHDGSQAPDNVINAPGTGLGDGFINAAQNAFLTGVAAVGADDLVNDHPIGVEYGGYTRTGDTAQIDEDFIVPQSATINGGTVI